MADAATVGGAASYGAGSTEGRADGMAGGGGGGMAGGNGGGANYSDVAASHSATGGSTALDEFGGTRLYGTVGDTASTVNDEAVVLLLSHPSHQPPPPAPPPTLPPTIAFEVTAAGSVSEYTDNVKSAVRNKIAVALAVAYSATSITITAASSSRPRLQSSAVSITVAIRYADSTAATAGAATLTSQMPGVEAASTLLSTPALAIAVTAIGNLRVSETYESRTGFLFTCLLASLLGLLLGFLLGLLLGLLSYFLPVGHLIGHPLAPFQVALLFSLGVVGALALIVVKGRVLGGRLEVRRATKNTKKRGAHRAEGRRAMPSASDGTASSGIQLVGVSFSSAATAEAEAAIEADAAAEAEAEATVEELIASLAEEVDWTPGLEQKSNPIHPTEPPVLDSYVGCEASDEGSIYEFSRADTQRESVWMKTQRQLTMNPSQVGVLGLHPYLIGMS